jgi:hypothetical protein
MKEVTFESVDAAGNEVTLKLSLDKAIKTIAKSMLANGTSAISSNVDDLHSVCIALEWTGKAPQDLRGDDDCG